MTMLMTKMVRRTISVMWLLAGAVGCTVEAPVLSDAARRVGVKPLSRPQIQHMSARPPDPGTPTVQRVYTHHMEAPEIDPQVRWGEGRSPVFMGL